MAKIDACPTGAWVLKQFGDGPCRVWVDDPPMPKLQDVAISSVVYLFKSADDARSKTLVDLSGVCETSRHGSPNAATGCLVEVPGKNANNYYVVTARHVVERGLQFPRFSFKDPSGDHGYVIDQPHDWRTVLVSTDLALLPVEDEVVAKNAHGIHYYSFLPYPRVYAGIDSIFHMASVGDTVAMPGRFFPTNGGATNRPVTRFGSLAVWPPVPMKLCDIENEQDVILADMRSHSGYSGSPVFLLEGLTEKFTEVANDLEQRIREVAYSIGEGILGGGAPSRCMDGLMIPDLDRPDVRFLGIDYGNVRENMAVIIPWYRVIEAIESEDLVKERTKKDRKNEPVATPDFQAPRDRPARQPGDFTKGDFIDALKKASKKIDN